MIDLCPRETNLFEGPVLKHKCLLKDCSKWTENDQFVFDRSNLSGVTNPKTQMPVFGLIAMD